MKDFFNNAAQQHHPLRALKEFLDRELASETAKRYSDLRFVGYVLDINYDTVTIITSDPFKIAVGGVPRNSLLIMTPASQEKIAIPHFTLLRVLDSAPTPLSKDTQQTYFELQKKSMPELDIFTQSELQWGALNTAVLGMFYPHPEKQDMVEFSGDMNNFVSAHKYRVYAPDDEILNLVINSLVSASDYFSIGDLRLTECRLPLPNKALPKVPVHVSPRDFLASRTAMFGKTRLGKSNVVKLIAQSLINAEIKDLKGKTIGIGQLIFDINGEYANDNPQDGNKSIRSANAQRCEVYALTKKDETESKPLKLNFYEQPNTALTVLESLLAQDNRGKANYVRSFLSVSLPAIDEIENLTDEGDKIRAARKVLLFWAVLKKAGYAADESALARISPKTTQTYRFDPGFTDTLRENAYSQGVPNSPQTLDELVGEIEHIAEFRQLKPTDKSLITSSKKPLFDSDDIALLDFLVPKGGGSGASIIQPYRNYHDPKASDFVKDVLESLDDGKTVILDLGNAHPTLLSYFSDLLSKSVFGHQVNKFSNNKLGSHFIQLYFEEAHNLFPRNGEPKDTYSRLAKEGAKYNIGVVYSTQSPSTIYGDLLAQTENFFIAHMSSQDEVNALAKMNVAYETLKDDILRTKTPGYIRMLTRSHRFVVPMQARKFEPKNHSDTNS
ncbi:MAG: ATP-binding protein [Caldilineaceae bacterium]|jgi:hypothetical protein